MTPSWLIFRACILTPWLGYLCWSDAKRRRLPNLLTLGGLAAGLCAQAGFNGGRGVTDGLLGIGLTVLILFVPFLLGAVCAGDLKMVAACSAFLGVRGVPVLLMAMSLAGLLVLLGLVCVNPVARTRLAHLARCVFDWRYDRAAGAAALPPASDARVGVPYGIAIALGMWATLGFEAWMLGGR